jgi:hypothetical protein
LVFASGEHAELVGGSGTEKLEFGDAKGTEKVAGAKIDFNGGVIIACEAGAVVRVADTKMP